MKYKELSNTNEPKDLVEEFAICTDEEVLNGNKFCYCCSEYCPSYKVVTKEEYETFWNEYDNE